MLTHRHDYIKTLEKQDFTWVGNIKADWPVIDSACEDDAGKHQKFWGHSSIGHNSYGNSTKEKLDNLKKLGYNPYNTRHWIKSEKDHTDVKWEKEIADKLPLQLYTTNLILQPPGNIIPCHKDYFKDFKKKYPSESYYIIRYIIFTKDWQTGHLLQAGNSFITHWKAGDVITWYPDRLHLSANVGSENKWTFNVTGILKEQVEYNF